VTTAELRPLAGGPAWLVIQLLERCNLRCNMCYEWGESGAYKSLPGLAELDLDLLLERLDECLTGKPRVEFFGGEPLLYRGIWKLLRVLGDAGCEVAFPTNGTTLARHAHRLVSPNPTCQMRHVRDECRQRGIRFFSQPRTLERETIAAYLSADWPGMADHHQRCAVPWMYAEISARGDVTTCHSFYDITVGNIYDRSLIDIWHGERAAEVRSHLRRELFSICTACTRYYASSAHPIAPTTAARRTDS